MRVPFFHGGLTVQHMNHLLFTGEYVTWWVQEAGNVHSQYRRENSIFISSHNLGSRARNDGLCSANQSFTGSKRLKEARTVYIPCLVTVAPCV